MKNNVCLLIVNMVTDDTGKSYKGATVYTHADRFCDIGPILDKWPNRLAVRVCPTLSDAKACAALEEATRYPVQVIRNGL